MNKRIYTIQDLKAAFKAGSDKNCWKEITLNNVVSGNDKLLTPDFEYWFEKYKDERKSKEVK